MKMESINPFTNAFHDGNPLLIFQFTLSFKNVIELASWRVLHYEIYVGLVCEKTVQPNQIYMVEEGLNLYLPDQLFIALLFSNGLLFNDFEGNCNARFIVPESVGGYLAR